jgi:hypothetical protein
VSLADIDIKRPPEIQETIDLIIKLPRELQEELAALMWIGRETEFEYFENALIHAKKAYTNPAEETLYIAAKPLFEYLPRAIEKLSEAGIALSE